MENKTRNVLLIVLPYLLKVGGSTKKLRSYVAFPYGVLSMATYLKTKSDHIDVQVLDCNIIDGEQLIPIIKQTLAQFKPDVVGLSMMFDNSYKHIAGISAAIREYNKETVIVLGGSAATSSYPQILVEQKNIDAVCYYEGEVPLLKMLSSGNMHDFLENDVAWITADSIRKGKQPQKNSLPNLDDTIDIDYTFVDPDNYAMGEGFSPFANKNQERKQFFLVSSRGCPYICSFCIHTADADKSMRYASIKEIVKHVELLTSKYGMNTLTFYDDQILMNKARAKELFRALAPFKLRIECPNGLTVAFMDEEMIEVMHEAGMDTVCLAIESGAPYVLNKIIHKPLNLKQVFPVVKNLEKHNFWIHGFFVTGVPGETDAHREETVQFIKDVGLDWSGFSLAVPSRGSVLYDICIKEGYIPKDLKIDELDANDYIINTPEYSAEYIKKKSYQMNLDVNFVNNKRMRLGDFRVAADAFRDVIKRYDNHAFAHYFLSKSLAALGKKKEAREAMKKYKEILKADSVWKDHAEFFKLT